MTIFNQDELATLNDDQLRGALFAVSHLFGVHLDNGDFVLAGGMKVLHEQVSQALTKSITDADPHTTEADVRFFENIQPLVIR